MDLQSVFYIVSIIAMILFIVLLLVLIYFVLFVKSVIARTEKTVVGKIMEYTKPVDVLTGMATSVAGNIFLAIQKKIGIIK